MQVVAVRFRGMNSKTYNSKEYFYKSVFPVEVGQEIVVHTSTNGLQIAMVSNSEVTPGSPGYELATAYTVQVIDTTKYTKILEQQKRIKALKTKMDQKLKEAQEMFIYEKLAEDDEAFAEILNEYKEALKELK